ncbi:MAG: hypothetical protein H6719_18300 [Sandaracinaceae bacterium]|nr:hypothetical protein [Sandaracinaceae bacterium]
MGRRREATTTLREARRRFFATNGFGADGGYDAPWVDATFGPFAYRLPNLRARARALRIHDLHHLVTGYATDWRGEAEISAWELGSGWGRYPYAWMIAIFGVLTGLLAQPRATWAAFARGRRSANLYPRRDVEPLMDRPLSEVARELHVPPSGAKHAVRLGDAGAFAITSITAIAFGFVAAPFVSGFVALGEMRRATRGGCPFTGAAHA